MRRRVLAIIAIVIALGDSEAWARQYSPETGRYLQFDPVGMQGGWNGYTYAENSPLLFIDPLGLTAKDPWFGYGADQGFKDWWHKMKPYYGGQDIPNKEVCDNLYKDYRDEQERGKGGKSSKGGQKKGDPRRPNVNELMRGHGSYGRGGGEE